MESIGESWIGSRTSVPDTRYEGRLPALLVVDGD